MKISNLKIYKKITKGKVKLCALSVAGMIAILSLTGCSNKNDNINTSTHQIVTMNFEPGKHILSIPIENPTKEIKQYTFHEGYKCVGIDTSAYGRYSSHFSGACLLFVNEYPVTCNTIMNNKGEMSFNDFGKPTGFEKIESEETEDYKIFMEGEHIISIPIANPTKNQMIYPSFEGYEPIGIALSSYGEYYEKYGGGCILYVNDEPVKCKKEINSNGEIVYPNFGNVYSKTKIKK